MKELSLSTRKKAIGASLTIILLIYAFINIIISPTSYDSKDLIELKKEFPILMSEVVRGIRLPDDSVMKVRPNGYTYLAYYYNLPKVEEINLIKQNIDSVGYWKVVPLRVQKDESNILSYCFKDVALDLSKYIYKESPSDLGFERLMVTIYYYKNSDCII